MTGRKLAIIIPLLLTIGCAGKTVYRDESLYPMIPTPMVRIRLLDTNLNLIVKSNKSFIVVGFHDLTAPSGYFESRFARVMPYGNGMVVLDENGGPIDIGLRRLSFVPLDEETPLDLSGRTYRGALEVLYEPGRNEPPSPPSLSVVNVINVEEYLKGVVPAEIGRLPEDEIEAAKAQAVAARTYAISHIGQYGGRSYDLESTVEDQVYRGIQDEDPVMTEAVEATRGLILAHRGKAIKAYYHSNCGGSTAYIENVWDKPPETYLVPVTDDYCDWSAKHDWETTWSTADLVANLSSFLDTLAVFPDGEFGDLIDLRIAQRSPSGRVEVLQAITRSSTYEIRKDAIRWALREGDDASRILPSTLFDLEIERNGDGSIARVTARGRGTGHGVGMCQTGAIGMAREGFSYRDILLHYYTGAALIVPKGR